MFMLAVVGVMLIRPPVLILPARVVSTAGVRVALALYLLVAAGAAPLTCARAATA